MRRTRRTLVKGLGVLATYSTFATMTPPNALAADARSQELIDVRATPLYRWSNNKGARREVAVQPKHAGEKDGFEWRIGIAYVTGDAPFSAFPGIDRWIVLLGGNGISMRSTDGSIDRKLDQPLEAFAFSGDTPIESQALNGNCDLFNVLVQRARYQASVDPIGSRRQLDAFAGATLLYSVHDSLRYHVAAQKEATLAPGEAVLWRNGCPSMMVRSSSDKAAGILVRISARA